jgi:hypothetical protein
MNADDIVKLLLDLIWSLPESARPSLGYGLGVAAATSPYWTGVAIMVLATMVAGCLYFYAESWDE